MHNILVYLPDSNYYEKKSVVDLFQLYARGEWGKILKSIAHEL